MWLGAMPNPRPTSFCIDGTIAIFGHISTCRDVFPEEMRNTCVRAAYNVICVWLCSQLISPLKPRYRERAREIGRMITSDKVGEGGGLRPLVFLIRIM